MLADLQRATTSAVRVAQAELHQIDAELRRLGKRSSRRSRKAITPNSQSVVPPIYATVVHVDSLTDAGKPVFAVSRAVIREAPRAEAGSQTGHNLYSNYSAMTRLKWIPESRLIRGGATGAAFRDGSASGQHLPPAVRPVLPMHGLWSRSRKVRNPLADLRPQGRDVNLRPAANGRLRRGPHSRQYQ